MHPLSPLDILELYANRPRGQAFKNIPPAAQAAYDKAMAEYPVKLALAEGSQDRVTGEDK